MSTYDDFLKERVEIGAGLVAKVYSWNGYAYKCFSAGYPKALIEYELRQQYEICKSDLPVPRYYESDFPNTIKMDLIAGVSMFDKLAIIGKDAMFDDFMFWFQKIHEVDNLELYSLSEHLSAKIDSAPVDEAQRAYARECFNEVEETVSEKTALCHMDFHTLNVMYEGDEVRIIDWVGAKNGKRIWDYSRTYVTLYEFAAGLKRRYMKRVMALEGYSEEIFYKAVYVNAVHRLTELDTKRIRQLMRIVSQ